MILFYIVNHFFCKRVQAFYILSILYQKTLIIALKDDLQIFNDI